MRIMFVLLFAAEISAAAIPPATQWAREEFERCAAQVFGKAPPVSFALPGDTADFADDFAALKDTDGYAVRRRGDTIVFVADCPKGHVNGVHRWLERNSDIIWPRPMGDMCFFTPREADISSLDCDYRDVPAFRLRFFGGGAADDETRRYLARNAVSPTMSIANNAAATSGAIRYGTIGAFCDVFGGGHDMETRWFPRKEFFAAHPEYWMEINGERWTGANSNFCETNPDFVKAYCGSVLAKIADLPPSVRIISINMEDTRRTCTCANCLKPIALPGGGTVEKDDPAFESTRFFIFFNEVARAVAKARPDLKILQFAYHHLTVPPKVPVERNVILKFCPYPRNMRESVMEGPSNADWRKKVDGWLANTPELYWREYYFCQCIMYPRPIADTAAIDLREISSRGVRYVYTDSPSRNGDGDTVIKMYSLFRPAREFFDMCAPEAWTVEKLFWNPSLDPEKLRADFIRRTFGPAAPHVAEFYRILRESWYTENLRSSFNDSNARNAALFIVSKGLTEKCRAALAAAENAASSGRFAAERRAWIAKMREILEMWVSEAPNYMKGEIAVPEIAVSKAQFPGMDFAAAPWPGATRMPTFSLVRSKHTADKSGSGVFVFADGDAFVMGFNVKKPGKVRALRPARKGAFPSGDKAEFSFGHGGTYYQFAFGAGGDKFEAKGSDSLWTCGWTVKTEIVKGGWRAVARVPFAAIGFRPEVDPTTRFMAMFSQSHGEARSQTVNYSLGGGIPHSPLTWTPIRVVAEDINRRTGAIEERSGREKIL